MGQLVINRVREYLQTMLPSLGLELFDVQFRKEGHGWVLRVIIDCVEGETGVTLNHCSDVSREVGAFLDVEDLIGHPYHLEVSSPGLERPLRSVDDFQRFAGKAAKVKLHEAADGQKIFEGTIDGVVDDKIHIRLADGQMLRMAFADINKARLVF